MAIAQFPRSYHQTTTPGSTILKADFQKQCFLHPNEHDVLSGRGGFVNAHPGNVRFRGLVNARKTEYSLESNKERKMEICRQVIALVHNNGGHFLAKENGTTSYWTIMSDERIVAKTNQALREGAPKIREAFQGTSSSKRARKPRSSVTPPPPSHNQSNNNGMDTEDILFDQPFVPIIQPSPDFEPVGTMTTTPMDGDEPTMMMLDDDLPDDVFRTTTVSPTHENTFQSPSNNSGSLISPSGMFGEVPIYSTTTTYAPVENTTNTNMFCAPLDPDDLSRRHSLVLSDISPHPNYLQEDFQNPFANESWFVDAGYGSLMEHQSSGGRRMSSSRPMQLMST